MDAGKVVLVSRSLDGLGRAVQQSERLCKQINEPGLFTVRRSVIVALWLWTALSMAEITRQNIVCICIGHGNPEVPRDNDLRNPVTQGYLRLKPESPELAGHPNLPIGKPASQ